MTLNLVPLSESLTSEISYDDASGSQCQGHASFDSSQNTLTLSVDNGASSCLSMNGIYAINLTESSLTLVGATSTLSFIN
jgi:hypothetical protein